MLVINYNGNKPTTDYFKYSVQGNSEIDVIRFSIQISTNELPIVDGYDYFAKVECEDDGYVDKIPLSEVYWNEEQGVLTALFHLKAQHTMHKQISVSFSAENVGRTKTTVWQTQLVKVNIANGIDADEQIEDEYPTIIQDYGRRITALEQGGGSSGGGVSDVKIEKVWLTYDIINSPLDKLLVHTYINLYDEEHNAYNYNDPRFIYFNIKTSKIDSSIEQAIQDGLFVVRFDYPVRKKTVLKLNGLSPLYVNYLPYIKEPNRFSHNNGAGYRSFTNSLYSKDSVSKEYFRIPKADRLLSTLIFVDENMIVERNNGEKYIHIKMSYLDLIKKLYETLSTTPIDDEMYDYYQDWFGLFENVYCSGLPNTSLNTTTPQRLAHLNSASHITKHSMPRNNSQGNVSQEIHGDKYLPTFSTYSPVFFTTPRIESGTTQFVDLFKSKLPLSRKTRMTVWEAHPSSFDQSILHLSKVHEDNYNVYSNNRRQLFSDMTAFRPRCCILTDDYETNTENMWAKKFTQSDQNVRIWCNGGLAKVQRRFCMLAFRIDITRK